jgi:sedoheptulose-bisphosphatase
MQPIQHLQVEMGQATSTQDAGSNKKTWLLGMGFGFACFALGLASALVALPLASHADSPQTSALAFMPLGAPTKARPVMNSRMGLKGHNNPMGYKFPTGRARQPMNMKEKASVPAEDPSQAEGFGASHTSFYTDAVKQDSYRGLQEVLDEHMKDKDLAAVISQMFDACATITHELRRELVTVAEDQSSVFGDVQLGVDVLADQLMWDECAKQPLIKEGASEEAPEVREMHKDGKFSIVWDPLDGSSIVDNNWAVGTIIGIWPASTGIVGATGRDQVTSIVAVYGPRTTVFVALDDGVYEFTYGAGGVDGWVASKEKVQIRPETKIYSPGNMRAGEEHAGYDALLAHYRKEKYTLRYTGGLVPDICQQFTKGMGVFTNPTSKSSPAKLRLAFEGAPFALLVEKAGGKSSNGIDGGSLLDVPITGIDQRTPCAMGSSKEVDRFNAMVVNSNVAAASPAKQSSAQAAGEFVAIPEYSRESLPSVGKSTRDFIQ